MKERWSSSARYLTLTLFVIFLALFLWYVRTIIQYLVMAAFVAYLISPIVTYIDQRTRLTRFWVVNIVYFTLLLLIIAAPVGLAPFFYGEVSRVVRDLMQLAIQLEQWGSQPVELLGFHFEFAGLVDGLSEFQGEFLAPLPKQVWNLLESTSRGALSFVVVVISTYFLLADWPHMRDWLISLFPEDYQEEVTELYRRLKQVWMSYLRSQIVLMVLVGVVFSIAWSVLGISGAVVLGGIAGLFTLVPEIGPFIALLLTMGVALLEGSSWIALPHYWIVFIVLVVYLAFMITYGLKIRPMVMGRSLRLNEGLVFIAIILATMRWGLLGALLVVPVIASLAVVGEYLRRRIIGLPPFAARLLFTPPPEEVDLALEPEQEIITKNKDGEVEYE
ncbi:MAG: AI-2E family transporter [Anaerolineales bacterium]|nr:AI-2E family transporter [Anaerolineales bacterium]